MARSYAGVLGLVAFATTIAHGLLHGRGAQSTMLWASLGLATFAVIGSLLGSVAAATVEEAARLKMARQLAAHKEAQRETAQNATQRESARAA
ncbi:MAG: hypothetical protein WD176_07950 [Pirellulales bacterium]